MFSVFLREAPFVRLLIPVIIGILVHNYYPFWNLTCSISLVILSLIGYVLIYRIPTFRKAQLQSITCLVIFLLLVCFSFALSHFHQQRNHPNYVQSGNQQLHLRLVEDPILKGKYYKARAKVLGQNNHHAQGEIMVYLEVSQWLPSYGDEVVVQTNLQKIAGVKNPYEFDYQRYLFHQGIDFQCFVRYQNWRLEESNTGNLLFTWSYAIKRLLEREFNKHFESETHIAMLKALLLGDKSGLDGDLKIGFAQTGTMHVMAVSGLHVGIVFAFMNGLLHVFFRKRWKLVGTLISLLALWFFALITGFSPSVSRACFMFSILAIGTQLNRNSSTYNSIACAAFTLLVIDPSSLFNVGFQFSFLAVLGIVSLQKPIRSLVKTNSWFISKLLDLTAVSVAAQLATLPLALYYFGQFPVLFFLSNLLVIPAITVILYAGLCFILFTKITVVAGVFAWLLKVYLWFVLQTVQVFQSIAYSFIDNIFMTKLDVVFLALLILALGTMLLGSGTKWSKHVVLLMGISLVTNASIRRFQNHNTMELVQFDLGKKTCLILRNGTSIKNVSNTNLSENDWSFRCKPYLVSRGVHFTDVPPKTEFRKVSEIIVEGGASININQLVQQAIHHADSLKEQSRFKQWSL